jgi:hypothetical protein
MLSVGFFIAAALLTAWAFLRQWNSDSELGTARSVWLGVLLPAGAVSVVAVIGCWRVLRQVSTRLGSTGVRQMSLTGWREVKWARVRAIGPGLWILTDDGRRLHINPRFFHDPDGLTAIVLRHLPDDARVAGLPTSVGERPHGAREPPDSYGD